MLYMDGILGLVVLGLWVFCLIDVITTDESLCRNLGKVMWLVLVLILPFIGSVAWLVAGRPQPQGDLPYKGNYGPIVADRERPVRREDPDPDREAAYQESLRRRAEEQRQIYRQRQRKELEGGDQSGS